MEVNDQFCAPSVKPWRKMPQLCRTKLIWTVYKVGKRNTICIYQQSTPVLLFGLYPSSCACFNHNVSQDSSSSVKMWTYLLGLLDTANLHLQIANTEHTDLYILAVQRPIHALQLEEQLQKLHQHTCWSTSLIEIKMKYMCLKWDNKRNKQDNKLRNKWCGKDRGQMKR
jgi:hypothetical protein